MPQPPPPHENAKQSLSTAFCSAVKCCGRGSNGGVSPPAHASWSRQRQAHCEGPTFGVVWATPAHLWESNVERDPQVPELPGGLGQRHAQVGDGLDHPRLDDVRYGERVPLPIQVHERQGVPRQRLRQRDRPLRGARGVSWSESERPERDRVSQHVWRSHQSISRAAHLTVGVTLPP